MRSLALLVAFASGSGPVKGSAARPRVIVTSDINIMHGDPDDRQSLVHLLLYLNVLDVRAIVADRSVEATDCGALRACHLAIDAYALDFDNPRVRMRERGFPDPIDLRTRIKGGNIEGIQAIIDEAHRDDPRPLYVLVWGHMLVLEHALYLAPDIVPRLRVLSIGTFRNPHAPPRRAGPNSAGREDIFREPAYRNLWWIENNGIAGMFHGLEYTSVTGPGETQRIPVGGEPYDLLTEIARYGALGRHMLEVTDGNPWARYFRAGDTPTVLYLIDPSQDPDEPGASGWAGAFERPFPEERPNHWVDSSYGVIDYRNPEVALDAVPAARRRHLEAFLATRPAFYADLLARLRDLHGG